MMKKIYPISILVLLFCFSITNAQILTFDFQGNLGTEATANSNYNDLVLGVSTISRGSGISASTRGNEANSFNSEGWSTTNIADAIANNDYVEFMIPAPSAGFSYSVTSINFDVQRTGNGITNLALRSSLDSYSANLDS